MPLLIALPMRWGLPQAVGRLSELLGVDLLAPYPLAMSYALTMLAPALVGMVVGFLLLDQRDDRTLTALQVTPLPLNSYLAYRLATPMLISFAMTLAAFPIAGFERLGMISLGLTAMAAAPFAPLLALLLASFATNKVQGFALVKASGVLLIVPLLAYFAPRRWEWAFALAPTYWPAKVFWTAQTEASGAWVYLLAGLIYQGLLLAVLVRRFDDAIHRAAS